MPHSSAIKPFQDPRLALMPRRHQMFLGGVWCDAESGDTFERVAPGNGVVCGVYSKAGEADVDKAVAAARAAFDSGIWSEISGAERGKVLLKVAHLLRENADELAFYEALESGKVISAARNEVLASAEIWEFCAGVARTLKGDVHSNVGPDMLAAIVREPIGVVSMVTPWNFPILILSQKLPFALAAGCTVVLKPSEFTPATTVMVTKLIEEAGLPSGVLNTVTGFGDPAGQRMLDHPKVDMLSFTGSTRVGKLAVHASAEHLKKVSLELGGKNAQVIFADADLDAAADAAVEGAFKNAGESCNCGARLLVERSAMDAFVEIFVALSKNVKVGDPLDPQSLVGAMIHEQQADMVTQVIHTAVDNGAEIALGGEGRVQSEAGYFMDLTILTNVSPDSSAAQDEIFGPVVMVIPFDSEKEAIEMANGTTYGLSASVWTENTSRALRCSRRLEAGTIWVNTYLQGPPELPFGGYKQSGIGRENGVAGVEEFTELKTIQFYSGARDKRWSDGW